MLSRAAESIYWMSRYIERAENVARFISVNLNLSLDMPGEAGEQWAPLIVTMDDEEAYLTRYGSYTQNDVIRFMTLDADNPNSIISCLRKARENARSVREIISAEMWEHLNKFYLMMENCNGIEAVMGDAHSFFSSVNFSGQQFLGITDATMTHGEGWHFSQIGRMLERADKTSRILDVKYYILLPDPADVGTPYDDIQWLALLRSASALEMYRQRHGRISPVKVVQFLILDQEFPRAVLHCLTLANESLHKISGTYLDGFSNPPEQKLGYLRAELAYSKAEQIISDGLHEFVDGFQRGLNIAGNEIHESFFAMRPMETPS
ncbi:MAG: alpha-E domain-containing protein [Planctomycetaceae bacterium]|nr:alpha-E domain-containing protein [Planctomycetaceae bacterium]